MALLQLAWSCERAAIALVQVPWSCEMAAMMDRWRQECKLLAQNRGIALCKAMAGPERS